MHASRRPCAVPISPHRDTARCPPRDISGLVLHPARDDRKGGTMAYEAEDSRNNPSAFLFLIDMSGSMTDPYANGKRKADGVADAINKLLTNLSITCTNTEGVREYYDGGVLGYGKPVVPAH